MKKHYLSIKPFIHWQQTERPINWDERFGRTGPVEVEIGFGNGAYLVKNAQNNPERNFVGIEVAWASVRRALRRINQLSVHNVRLLLVDTRVALEYLIAPHSLDRAYTLFPMPWPKKKHIKFRLFSQEFLKLLNNRLTADGDARVVTDHEEYAQWIQEQVPGTGFSVDENETSAVFETKYERKWQDQGQETFFDLHLVKTQSLDFTEKEEQPLKTYCADNFNPERFHPALERGEVVVKFEDYLFDPEREKAMARALVVEDTLTQTIWIEIDRGERGWYIHVAAGSGALPTVGVQRAVDLAYEAVVASNK